MYVLKDVQITNLIHFFIIIRGEESAYISYLRSDHESIKYDTVIIILGNLVDNVRVLKNDLGSTVTISLLLSPNKHETIPRTNCLIVHN